MPSSIQPRWTNRAGGWLPQRHHQIRAFIKILKLKSKALKGLPLTPCVQEFKTLIESSGSIYQACNSMIAQANELYPEVDPDYGLTLLKDYDEMCILINTAILEPPLYNETDLVAFPINAIFDLSMATPAGYAFFSSERVNLALGKILNYWGAYLSSSDSLIAFQPVSEGGGGWMSDDAVSKLHMHLYDVPDPNALAWGYQSWNKWFIREFKAGVRPIASPKDTKVVCNACESTPFELQEDVQLRSSFWLKGQKYSLAFMLGSESGALPFVGGVVYQAFLSAFNYHRWHAPVDGVVVEAFVIPGTYYAESPAVGLDVAGPDLSQGYITNVAARAVMKIEADDPDIGLMCVVAVGMSEVSSNIISANVGTHVRKGDELGYFQFGGSTHCLVFRKGVIAEWSSETNRADVIPINSKIATVGSHPRRN